MAGGREGRREGRTEGGRQRGQEAEREDRGQEAERAGGREGGQRGARACALTRSTQCSARLGRRVQLSLVRQHNTQRDETLSSPRRHAISLVVPPPVCSSPGVGVLQLQ